MDQEKIELAIDGLSNLSNQELFVVFATIGESLAQSNVEEFSRVLCHTICDTITNKSSEPSGMEHFTMALGMAFSGVERRIEADQWLHTTETATDFALQPWVDTDKETDN